MLFNVYLEEAIKGSKLLEDIRSRGDVLAFADDMLVCSNSKAEIEQAIRAIEGWRGPFNLKINKSKSEVLTGQPDQEIGGVKCAKVVEYLGIKVVIDRKEQTRVTRE